MNGSSRNWEPGWGSHAIDDPTRLQAPKGFPPKAAARTVRSGIRNLNDNAAHVRALALRSHAGEIHGIEHSIARFQELEPALGRLTRKYFRIFPSFVGARACLQTLQ